MHLRCPVRLCYHPRHWFSVVGAEMSQENVFAGDVWVEFLIDPVEVAILTVASAIGAFAAAIILHVLTRLLKFRRKAWSTFIFLVLGGMSGIAFLTPRLTDLLAPTLVRVLPDPIYFETALNDPLLDRLSRDHPELMQGIEARLVVAHLVGGVEQVKFEGERFGLQKSTAMTADYFRRARPDDLLRVMSLQRDIFESLLSDHPDLCYPFLFGLERNELALAEKMNEVIPHALEDETRALIVGAFDDTPEFDNERGAAIIEGAQVNIAIGYGEDGLALMAGARRPEGQREERELCAIYAEFLSTLSANRAGAVDAYRTLFSKVAGT